LVFSPTIFRLIANSLVIAVGMIFSFCWGKETGFQENLF